MISVPLGPVPINIVHIPIFLSAWILGPKLAMLAQIVYILMGIVGLPVFSGFTAGLGHVIGPAGGFIWSYPVVAFVSGCIACKWMINIVKRGKLIYFGIYCAIAGIVTLLLS